MAIYGPFLVHFFSSFASLVSWGYFALFCLSSLHQSASSVWLCQDLLELESINYSQNLFINVMFKFNLHTDLRETQQ